MPENTINHIEEIRREAWRMVPEIMTFARNDLDSLVGIDDVLNVADMTDEVRIDAIRWIIRDAIQRIGPLGIDLVRLRRDIMDALLRIDEQGVKLPAELTILVGKYRQTLKALVGGE